MWGVVCRERGGACGHGAGPVRKGAWPGWERPQPRARRTAARAGGGAKPQEGGQRKRAWSTWGRVQSREGVAWAGLTGRPGDGGPGTGSGLAGLRAGLRSAVLRAGMRGERDPRAPP